MKIKTLCFEKKIPGGVANGVNPARIHDKLKITKWKNGGKSEKKQSKLDRQLCRKKKHLVGNAARVLEIQNKLKENYWKNEKKKQQQQHENHLN